jgi:hypothetical protein
MTRPDRFIPGVIFGLAVALVVTFISETFPL